MPRHTLAAAAIALASIAAGAACDDTISGLTPVGGDQPSEARIERFARRLHLDLAGAPPDAAFLADAVARVAGAGNTAAVRRELAAELLDAPAFAALWIDELERRVFGGQPMEGQYAFVCAVLRGQPACGACPPPGADPCEGCACGLLPQLAAERADLRVAAEDAAAGASTSSIERRYAAATPIRALAGPEGTADVLFTAFLGHAPQAEPRAAAAAMVIGSFVPGSPAGLLFHRHGADFDDLLEILFGSAVYREAAVTAVFGRYLGRRPTAAELGHFAATLDPDDPDARAVILAVLSSREYFDQ